MKARHAITFWCKTPNPACSKEPIMTQPLQTYNLPRPNKTSPNCLADFREDAGDSSKILWVSSLDHQLPVDCQLDGAPCETFHLVDGFGNNVTKREGGKNDADQEMCNQLLTDRIWYSDCLSQTDGDNGEVEGSDQTNSSVMSPLSR